MLIIPRPRRDVTGNAYVEWLEQQPPLAPLATEQFLISSLAIRPRQTPLELIRYLESQGGIPYLSRPTYIFRTVTPGIDGQDFAPDSVKNPSMSFIGPTLTRLGLYEVVEHEWVDHPADPQRQRNEYSLARGIGGISLPLPHPMLPHLPTA